MLLGPGDTFGAHVLLHPGSQSPNSVWPLSTGCELFLLRRDKYETITQEFPGLRVRLEQHEKHSIDRLCCFLATRVALFEDCSCDLIKAVVETSQRRVCQPKQVLVFESRKSEGLFIVIKGKCLCYKPPDPLEEDGEPKHVHTIYAGGHFGELSLLDDSEAVIEVIADVDTEVLMLPRAKVGPLGEDYPEFLDMLDSKKTDYDAINFFLNACPMLTGCEIKPLKALSEKCKANKYNAGTLLQSGAGPPLAMYFVKQGQLAASVAGNDLVTAVLAEGEVFGLEVLTGENTSREVRCGTECEVLVLDASDGERLVEQHPKLLELIEAEMEKQRERDGDRDDPNKSDADGNVDPATVATNQAIEMVKQLSIALRGQQLILGMLQNNVGEITKRMGTMDSRLEELPRILQNMESQLLESFLGDGQAEDKSSKKAVKFSSCSEPAGAGSRGGAGMGRKQSVAVRKQSVAAGGGGMNRRQSLHSNAARQSQRKSIRPPGT